MLKCIYSESVFNTLYIKINHICFKIFPSDKTGGTKNVFFFFHEFQIMTYLLLICEAFNLIYISRSTRFVSLKLCEGFSIDLVSFY